MPFTLAHPAAVLPVWWLLPRLPLVGLVVGAMVPDVAYFLALRPTGAFGHTLPGVVLQGIPAGLVLCAGWRFVREPLLQTLPAALAGRVPPPQIWRLWSLSAAIVIGAASHLLWDGFTHEHGFAVEALPGLAGDLGPLPAFKWLQHGGGVLGLVALAAVGGVWLSRQPLRPVTVRPVRQRVLCWGWLALGSVGLSAWAMHGGGGLSTVVVRGVIGSVSGFALAVCGLAVVSAVWRPRG